MALPRVLQPNILVVFLLGFASGLPLALTGSTLKAWLKSNGLGIEAIAFSTYLSLPYALKFLWSPLMDRCPLPYLTRRLGQRVGWMAATQILLIASLLGMAWSRPELSLLPISLLALLTAFFSASQDIVIDAYRTEYLAPEDYGRGAASAVFGYRVGMLVAGAGALILADHLAWPVVYAIMAALLGIGLLTALVAGEPPVARPPEADAPATRLRDAVIEPFRQFTRAHAGWAALLLFILLFRLPEAFIGATLIPFQRDIGFSWSEIGGVSKLVGFGATLLGAFAASALLGRFGMWRAWLWLGLLQIPSNLALLLLIHTGPQRWALALSIGAENLVAGALGTLAAAFLMRLCDRRYTATQYALLSALAALGAILLAGPAGMIAQAYGYTTLFQLSALLGLPGFWLLWRLRRHPAFAPIET